MLLKPHDDIKAFLDRKYLLYNQPDFITNDPISIPHQFSKLQDIEIMGFWTAILAWGQRKTIIQKSNELISLMDHAPHDFIINHEDKDLQRFENFKHRTFNFTDTLYFFSFFKNFYSVHFSLEKAFLCEGFEMEDTVEQMFIHFHNLFFHDEHAPQRTRKHIASPLTKSTCKRLNMFLRWMVRNDDRGVDFGVWKKIKSHQLLCPLDVHVESVARRLGLIERKQKDWETVKELTANLKKFDTNDPVKYDFSLFGTGVYEKWHDI